MAEMSLREVLDLPVLREGDPEVLSGSGALREPIRWVHVSELEELSALLQGGELLLTTGMGLPSDEAGQERYIENLERAGVRGVILELGRRFASAPRGLLRAGRRVGFPLVVLHRAIPFVAVTEAVHSRIVSDQVERLRFSQHVHETFSTLSIEEPDISEVLRRAQRLAGAPVVLEDLAHQVLDCDLGTSSATSVLRDWERRSRDAADSGASRPLGNEYWLVSPVGPSQHMWGRLVLLSPQLDEDSAMMLLERAAQALALARLLERDRRGVEQRVQAGLLAELSRGRIHGGSELSARAEALGLARGQRYLAVGLAARGGQGSSDAVDPRAAERTDARVVDIVTAAAQACGRTALAAALSPRTVSAVLSLPAEVERDLERFAAAVQQRLAADREIGDEWVIGVSRDNPTLTGAGPLLDEAAHVARVAAALPGNARRKAFYRSSDVRLRGLLSLLRDDPRVLNFESSELDPLRRHDERHGTGLVELLRGFLHFSGNKTQLAQHAHLSRPALYNRLATIEHVLGVDLDAAESRVSLHVALLVAEVRAEMPGDGR
jgi:purine catabolism regulator